MQHKLRVITWNCQGAFRKKYAYVLEKVPDIAVIQECEQLNSLTFDSDGNPESMIRCGGKKGVGIFSFRGYHLEIYEEYDESIMYCIPLRVYGRHRFNVIAVWAMPNHISEQSYIGQIQKALTTYHSFINECATLVIGDFNWNMIWDDPRRMRSLGKVIRVLDTYHIRSAYHYYFREKFGNESRMTFYMSRKATRGYHIDYIFAPTSWCAAGLNVEVGTYDEWCQRSDHCPLIADFTIP